jgi:hypothetical protein
VQQRGVSLAVCWAGGKVTREQVVAKLKELLVLKLAMQVGVRCEFDEGDRLCRGRGVTGSSGSVLGWQARWRGNERWPVEGIAGAEACPAGWCEVVV